ncbi:MAG TPA: hypothetical protein DD614_02500 [Clostridiales bacterium]|nr:hypothetical protein [Clostridiales bacterium]
MAVSEKQKELDSIKWEKSIRLGFDACGSFDYCMMCDKNLENPCEKAFNKYYNVDIMENHELVIGAESSKFEIVEPKKATKKATKSSTKKTTKSKETKTKKTTKSRQEPKNPQRKQLLNQKLNRPNKFNKKSSI